MRLALSCLATLAVCTLVGCNAQHFPASPVPAVLTDREAVSLADRYLADREIATSVVTNIEPQDWGYLVGYHSTFDPNLRPPKLSRLVAVKNDGDVREWTFREGR
jgi:hypothetical protein